jgi:hypothetical protein
VRDFAKRSSTSRWLSAIFKAGVAGRIGHPTTKPTYLRDTTLAEVPEASLRTVLFG